MTVRVRYYVLFWLHAGRLREEDVELPEGATVATLVAGLGERHGSAFAEKVIEDGKVHRFCWLLLNGRRMEPSCLDEVVRDGDEVVLTTPLLVGG